MSNIFLATFYYTCLEAMSYLHPPLPSNYLSPFPSSPPLLPSSTNSPSLHSILQAPLRPLQKPTHRLRAQWLLRLPRRRQRKPLHRRHRHRRLPRFLRLAGQRPPPAGTAQRGHEMVPLREPVEGGVGCGWGEDWGCESTEVRFHEMRIEG